MLIFFSFISDITKSVNLTKVTLNDTGIYNKEIHKKHLKNYRPENRTKYIIIYDGKMVKHNI